LLWLARIRRQDLSPFGVAFAALCLLQISLVVAGMMLIATLDVLRRAGMGQQKTEL